MRRFVLDGAELVIADAARTTPGELMARAAQRAMKLAAGDVVVGKRCARCGSSEHGQPFATLPTRSGEACALSFSRASGYTIAAARSGTGVGVDIESVSKVASHSVEEVLFHPAEREQRDQLGPEDARRYDAQLWVAKEAIAKSTGIGLRIDLTDFCIRIDGTVGDVLSWPGGIDLGVNPRVSLFDVSDDIVGALATWL